jgi:tetratricopeptide (TPR) repeat protein
MRPRRTGQSDSAFALMSRAHKIDPLDITSWPRWAPYAPLALAVFAVFGNIYGNTFAGDDIQLIVNNHFLRDWGSIGRIFVTSALSGSGSTGDLYRPLQILIDLVIYQTFGLQPVVFHVLSVALQAANVCLVYALGRKLDFKLLPVFLAALVWGVHPIEAESITHISAVADLLFAFFCLIGFLLVLPDFSPRKIALVCPIFVLGLLSKEAAVIFPALVVVTMFLVSPRRRDAKIHMRTWPLWLIAGIYILLRFTVLDFQSADVNLSSANAIGHAYATHFLYRFYTCLATLPLYVKQVLWPVGLHFEIYFPVYSDPFHWQVMLGLAFVLAVIAQLLWGQGRRGLALSWGLLWFGASLAPDTGLLIPATFLFAEHWLYLPSAGLFLGVAQTAAKFFEARHWKKMRAAGVVAGLLLACAVGALTFQQNRAWRDNFTLYSYMLTFNEPLPRAHTGVAEMYMRRGELDKSLAELRIANSYLDTVPQVHNDIAYVLMLRPDWRAYTDEAIAELNRTLELSPDYASAYEGLAFIYSRLGDKKKERFYEERIQEIQNRN